MFKSAVRILALNRNFTHLVRCYSDASTATAYVLEPVISRPIEFSENVDRGIARRSPNEEKGLEKLGVEEPHTNLHSLINAMMSGQVINATTYYPQILEWVKSAEFSLPNLVSEGKETQNEDYVENSRSLSDEQLSILILAGSTAHGNVRKNVRDQYLQNLLYEIRKKGVTLGVRSANAMLMAMLDNGRDKVDANKFLTKLMESGVNPNSFTFELISRFYALNANPRAILKLMSVIMEEGYNLSVTLFKNLAFAEASNTAASFSKQKQSTSSDTADDKITELDENKSKKLESVHRAVELFTKMTGATMDFHKTASVAGIYMSAAIGFAAISDLTAVIETFEYVTEKFLHDQKELLCRNFRMQIMEAYLLLLEKGVNCDMVFESLKPYLNLHKNISGEEVLLRFDRHQLLGHLFLLEEQKNWSAIFHLEKLTDGQLKSKKKLKCEKMLEDCLKMLENNNIDGFRDLLAAHRNHKYYMTLDTFYWRLLLEYFEGNEELLTERLKHAIILYLKLINFADVDHSNSKLKNKSNKTHRLVMHNFLNRAIARKASNDKDTLYKMVLDIIEETDSKEERIRCEALAF